MVIQLKQDLIRKPTVWPFILGEDINGNAGALNSTYWDVVENIALVTSYTLTDAYGTDQTVDPGTTVMAQVYCNVSADEGTAEIYATTVDEIPVGMNFFFWSAVNASPNGTPNECSGTVYLIGSTSLTVQTVNKTNSGSTGEQASGWVTGLTMGFYIGNNQWKVYAPNCGESTITASATGGLKVRIKARYYENASNQAGTSYAGVGNIYYGR